MKFFVKKQYTIGICGHFAFGKSLSDGQTIKTTIFYDELKEKIGKEDILVLDTYSWKKNPFKLLINCVLMNKYCDNIIIMPAHNGLFVFSFLFSTLNVFFEKKLHYIVIGGWLAEVIRKNPKLKKYLFKFKGIYVETSNLLKELKKMNFNNVYILKNCKNLKILSEDELNTDYTFPLKICTFSRVMKEKGIEDIIYAVNLVNKKFNETIFHLDIFGQIDVNYTEKFKLLSTSFPEYICYKGIIPYNQSVEILKNYYCLIFPTRFYTEGIPGTIIDAYASGLPVISSKWESFNDVIEEGRVGLGYEYLNIDELIHILLSIKENPELLIKMKYNTLKKAKEYSNDEVINYFIEEFILNR